MQKSGITSRNSSRLWPWVTSAGLILIAIGVLMPILAIGGPAFKWVYGAGAEVELRAHHDTLQGQHTPRKAVAPHRSMVVDILLCSHILYVLSRSGSIGLACIHPCRRLHPALHLNHDSACRKVIAQLKSNREKAKNRLKSAFWFQ